MIRAVLFDVDGVLIDSRQANIAFYRALLTRHGYTDLVEDDLARGHYLTLLEAIALISREPSEERVREIWEDARALADYPYDMLRLPEGGEETLARLRERYQLGIVTSRMRQGVDHFFDYSGFDSYFSVSISYEDYENPKPAPDPLLAACDRLNLRPHETVYIGDAQTDLACAEAAGAHFIAYGGEIIGAKHEAACFADLPPLVRLLEGA